MHETAQISHVFETSHGHCGIAWNSIGIVRFHLPAHGADTVVKNLRRHLPGAVIGAPTPEIGSIIAAVKRYFEGEKIDFSNLTLDLRGQDPFYTKIYEALRRVDWGRTTTYGTLARDLGARPEAARDVGQAMAKNPVPLIIPCHRVLAAGGKVGGFSAPGGATAKVRMLKLEGVRTGAPEPAQRSLEF